MSLQPINISSYRAFKTDALLRASQDLGYDVDNHYGYQCWDLAAELWMNIPEFGSQQLWPKTGPNSYAEECWTVSKDINTGNSFIQITDKTQLRLGDVVVIGPSPISLTGHIAFCDEDYSSDDMMLLGQNQVNPSLTLGHIPTVTQVNISAFLGAFRYIDWIQPTPPQPSTSSKSRLPIILTSLRLQGYNVL